MNDGLGKKAEAKIREWLDKPEQGYCFDRIPDNMSGFIGSKNICDFTLFKKPHMYFIESKSTYEDRFNFSMITEYQFSELLKKSKIDGVYGLVSILFASYKRAFILNIQEINSLIKSKKKSINITKILKWDFKFVEIPTIQSKKLLLDYSGEFEDVIKNII